MTPALYTFTLLAGLVLGWQGSLLALAMTTRQRAGERPGVARRLPLRSSAFVCGAPGRTIDLRDGGEPVAGGGPTPPAPPATAPFDWRRDAPDVAACHACHGKGRIWSIEGYGHKCPCGAPITRTRKAAAR